MGSSSKTSSSSNANYSEVVAADKTSANTAQAALISLHIDNNEHRLGPLLPILHDIQNQLGYIPDTAISEISKRLNLSRAEVHGVVSFYHHFSTKPRGRHIIEVCCAESCQALGGRELQQHAKDKLGLDWYETTKDGEITLEPVYCLGNCACSPAVRVGLQILGRVANDDFDELIDELTTVPITLIANS
jgi:formate dehydrogenase subunit gamma